MSEPSTKSPPDQPRPAKPRVSKSSKVAKEPKKQIDDKVLDKSAIAKILDEYAENTDKDTTFYTKAEQYWSKVSPSMQGMLGGFEEIHNLDIMGSKEFLSTIFSTNPLLGKKCVLDCGAGIGRVSTNLLCSFFDKVDLLDVSETFLEQAKSNFKAHQDKLGCVYNCGLQDFTPETQKYDVVWCQWVLGHLTDIDLLRFFERILYGLTENGVLIIKDNTTSSNKVEFDEEDSSVTRPLKLLTKIIQDSGFRGIELVRQEHLPKYLYPIYMMAYVPRSRILHQKTTQDSEE